jgi:hypothetical protein
MAALRPTKVSRQFAPGDECARGHDRIIPNVCSI